MNKALSKGSPIRNGPNFINIDNAGTLAEKAAYLFEGDIRINKANRTGLGGAIASGINAWPGGIIPYTIVTSGYSNNYYIN